MDQISGMISTLANDLKDFFVKFRKVGKQHLMVLSTEDDAWIGYKGIE